MAIAADAIININPYGIISHGGGGIFVGSVVTSGNGALTNGVTTNGTSAYAGISSATYNFTSADINNYLYISNNSNVNWIPGWYKITGVIGTTGYVDAAIGHGMLKNTYSANSPVIANTGNGISLIDSNSYAVFSIDRSWSPTPYMNIVGSGFTSASPWTTVNAPLGVVDKTFLGNCIRISGGTNWIPGWYIMTTIPTTSGFTVDHAIGATATVTDPVGYIGGALNAIQSGLSPDIIPNLSARGTIVAGNTFFIATGTYNAVANTTWGVAGTAAAAITINGYQNYPFDTPSGNDMPFINQNNFLLTFGNYNNINNIRFSGNGAQAGAGILTFGTYGKIDNVIINNDANTAKVGVTFGTYGTVLNCNIQVISGTCVVGGIGTRCCHSYIHDSFKGIAMGAVAPIIQNCIIDSCFMGIDSTNSSGPYIEGNLFICCGAGLWMGTAGAINLYNNIFANCATGIYNTTYAQTFQKNNLFINNISNRASTVEVYPDNIYNINPFIKPDIIYGITGRVDTGQLNILKGTGLFTGITTNDCLMIVSGTNSSMGVKKIISATNDELTCQTSVASAASSNIRWSVVPGSNFGIGYTTSGLAYPFAITNTNIYDYRYLGPIIPPNSGSVGDVIINNYYYNLSGVKRAYMM